MSCSNEAVLIESAGAEHDGSCGSAEAWLRVTVFIKIGSELFGSAFASRRVRVRVVL